MKISVGKLNKDVSIDPKDLENILKPLDTTIDSQVLSHEYGSRSLTLAIRN